MDAERLPGLLGLLGRAGLERGRVERLATGSTSFATGS